jgi:hypothetical protein
MKDSAPGNKGAPSWAKGQNSDNPAATMETFQRGLTVRLISTDRSAFETCASDEALAAVVDRNRRHDFDYLPVTEPISDNDGKRARIVGLLEIDTYMHGQSEPQGLVRQQMRPLLEENLIGADASILTFVRHADSQPCRLVISGSEISGLVSLSDLQRLPVRAALFGMVTHLEIVMAGAIRAEFGTSDDWMGRLLPDQRRQVAKKVVKAKENDAYVHDMLLFTQFSDKVTVIKERQNLRWDRGEFEDQLHQIQDLRNDLAHAKDYAVTRNLAKKVCETVRLIEAWTNRLMDGVVPASSAAPVTSPPAPRSSS